MKIALRIPKPWFLLLRLGMRKSQSNFVPYGRIHSRTDYGFEDVTEEHCRRASAFQRHLRFNELMERIAGHGR